MVKVRLAELLAARGWTVYRLSKETGIPHPTFMRLMRAGRQEISFHVLEAICTTFDCTPNDVLQIVPTKPARRRGRKAA